MRPRSCSAFLRDARAHSAMVFALTLMPVAAITGFAIDGSNSVATKQHLQYVLDASVLAGARSFKSDFSTEMAETAASETFDANILTVRNDVTCAVNTVTADRINLSVTMDASCQIPTTFGTSIMGKSEVSVSAAAEAAARHKIADVSMVLDLSGSMSDPEIADLKVAAKRAATLIIGNHPGERGRVALAPFASGVNAGDFGNLVTGRVSGADPENDNEADPYALIERVCVTERTGMDMFTDAAPVPGNYIGSVITPVDASARLVAGSFVQASSTACPDSPILPLENSISAVHSAIDGLQRSTLNHGGGANTAGHMGIAWAWYMLSPNWTSVWTNTTFGGAARHTPHPYGDPNRPKVVILMSDGLFQFGFEEPFTSYNWSEERRRANAAATQFCQAMHDEGIIIYAIAYNLNPDHEMTMRFCAGDPARFLATDEADKLIDLYEQVTRDFLGVGLVG